MTNREIFFVGDCYDGSYGPTILLKTELQDAVRWLHGLLIELATGVTESIDLHSMSEISFPQVNSFRLQRVSSQSSQALRKAVSPSGDLAFDWSQVKTGWQTTVKLLDPLAEGGVGHQYLTDEVKDEALLEVSVGEPDVGAELWKMLGPGSSR